MNRKNKKLLSKMNNEKRRSSLEKIKRKKRRELFLIVTLFLAVISGVAFMFSNYVKLKNIEVQGYHQITKEEILEAGGVNSNLRTWSVKDDEVKNNIQNKYNIFKSVSVESKMPSTININVEEYRFIAKNKKNDGTYEIIMENNEVYSGEVRNNHNLPILENFNEDDEKLKEVYKNLVELKYEVLTQISEIINEDGETLLIYMNDGQKVKVLRANFSEKLNFYDEMAKYITDKKDSTLNLVNGTYLETNKTSKQRTQKINSLLQRSNSQVVNETSEEKVKESSTEEKDNKTENSTTTVRQTTQNRNTMQQSTSNQRRTS